MATTALSQAHAQAVGGQPDIAPAAKAGTAPGVAAPVSSTDAVAPASSLALPEITATAQQPVVETGTGPVKGYVAHRTTTGTKTDTPILETPQSVSIITADRIRDQHIESMTEALRYTPGGYGASDTRGDYATIRGFTPDIYLDGLRLPTPASAYAFRVEPTGLERIEILRGANSALYGQANLGGIINAISKRPQENPQQYVALQGGSFGRIQGMFDVGGKASKDGSLLWRMNGMVRDADTQVDGQRDNRIYMAPSVTWKPNAKTTWTILASYMRDDLGITGQWLPPQGTVLYNPNGRIPRSRTTGEPGWDYFRRSQYSLASLFDYAANSVWTFRQNLRWTYHEVDYKTNYATNFSPTTQDLLVSRVASQVNGTYWSAAVDNQAQARFDTGPAQHTLLMGVDYRAMHVNSRTRAAAGTRLNVYDPVYGVTVPNLATTAASIQLQQQVGLYAQEQLRYGNWVLTLTGRQDFADTAAHNALTKRDTSQRDSAFTGRAAITYVTPIGVAPYFSYSTSFLPNVGTMSPARGSSTFQPTTGTQYEAGVKYQPRGINALITAALYQVTQQNVLTTDPANTLYNIQTGEVRVRGFELEATASLARGLNMTAAWTIQDPEITKSTLNNLGRRPMAVASHMASLWADYNYPINANLTVGLGGGVRYIGNTLGNNTPTATNPQFNVQGFTLFDAVAHADYKNWRLSLNGANLADKTYVQTCQVTCTYGTGRTLYATLAYRW